MFHVWADLRRALSALSIFFKHSFKHVLNLKTIQMIYIQYTLIPLSKGLGQPNDEAIAL